MSLLRSVLICGLWSCTPQVFDVPEEIGPTIASRYEAGQGGAGVLHVQVAVPDGVVPLVPTPGGEGLTLESIGEMEQERVGVRQVLTWRWSVSGAAGSYEIQPLDLWVAGVDDPLARTSSLFVDLDVEPPREGTWADISDPSRVRVIPWAWVLGVGSIALLSLAGVIWAFRRPRAEIVVEVPREAPDVVVLRGWESVRRDGRLDDYTKALALSRLFRDYLEAVLAFPATAWTTTETVGHLRGLSHLQEHHVPEARRLLRATDRVKYAGDQPGQDLFELLTEDLSGFVEATRPHRWEEEQA